jgi:hypothetical protein
MKKSLLIIIVLATVFFNSSSAQQPSKTVMSTKEVTVNKNKYTVRKSQTGNTFVEPASFKARGNTISPLGTEVPLFRNKDDQGLIKAFYEVFDRDRLQKLLPERSMLVVFNINAETGGVISTNYMLRKNSVITLDELDRLSAAFKKHVIFVFNKRDLKGASDVNLTYNLSLSKLMGGSMVLR